MGGEATIDDLSAGILVAAHRRVELRLGRSPRSQLRGRRLIAHAIAQVKAIFAAGI